MDDAENFAAFVAARTPSLLRLAWLLAADLDAAEDIVQEALARTVPRWRRVSRGGNPEAYVRAVIRSVWVDTWRRRRRWPTALGGVPERGGDADEGEDAVRRLAVAEALARLAPRQRAVLVLRFYEDLTEVETARCLGCTTSTVKSTAREALARLRVIAPELVADLGAEPAGPGLVRRAGPVGRENHG
jgi:RNA polymerase sigma-70 factor (sigma-E family)